MEQKVHWPGAGKGSGISQVIASTTFPTQLYVQRKFLNNISLNKGLVILLFLRFTLFLILCT